MERMCTCVHTRAYTLVHRHMHACVMSAVSYRAKVDYDYSPKETDELALIEGQFLHVDLEYNDGWCRGSNAQGLCGLFPANHITPLSPPTAPVPQRWLQAGRNHPNQQSTSPAFASGRRAASSRFIYPRQPKMQLQRPFAMGCSSGHHRPKSTSQEEFSSFHLAGFNRGFQAHGFPGRNRIQTSTPRPTPRAAPSTSSPQWRQQRPLVHGTTSSRNLPLPSRQQHVWPRGQCGGPAVEQEHSTQRQMRAHGQSAKFIDQTRQVNKALPPESQLQPSSISSNPSLALSALKPVQPAAGEGEQGQQGRQEFLWASKPPEQTFKRAFSQRKAPCEVLKPHAPQPPQQPDSNPQFSSAEFEAGLRQQPVLAQPAAATTKLPTSDTPLIAISKPRETPLSFSQLLKPDQTPMLVPPHPREQRKSAAAQAAVPTKLGQTSLPAKAFPKSGQTSEAGSEQRLGAQNKATISPKSWTKVRAHAQHKEAASASAKAEGGDAKQQLSSKQQPRQTPAPPTEKQVSSRISKDENATQARFATKSLTKQLSPKSARTLPRSQSSTRALFVPATSASSSVACKAFNQVSQQSSMRQAADPVNHHESSKSNSQQHALEQKFLCPEQGEVEGLWEGRHDCSQQNSKVNPQQVASQQNLLHVEPVSTLHKLNKAREIPKGVSQTALRNDIPTFTEPNPPEDGVAKSCQRQPSEGKPREDKSCEAVEMQTKQQQVSTSAGFNIPKALESAFPPAALRQEFAVPKENENLKQRPIPQPIPAQQPRASVRPRSNAMAPMCTTSGQDLTEEESMLLEKVVARQIASKQLVPTDSSQKCLIPSFRDAKGLHLDAPAPSSASSQRNKRKVFSISHVKCDDSLPPSRASPQTVAEQKEGPGHALLATKDDLQSWNFSQEVHQGADSGSEREMGVVEGGTSVVSRARQECSEGGASRKRGDCEPSDDKKRRSSSKGPQLKEHRKPRGAPRVSNGTTMNVRERKNLSKPGIATHASSPSNTPAPALSVPVKAHAGKIMESHFTAEKSQMMPRDDTKILLSGKRDDEEDVTLGAISAKVRQSNGLLEAEAVSKHAQLPKPGGPFKNARARKFNSRQGISKTSETGHTSSSSVSGKSTARLEKKTEDANEKENRSSAFLPSAASSSNGSQSMLGTAPVQGCSDAKKSDSRDSMRICLWDPIQKKAISGNAPTPKSLIRCTGSDQILNLTCVLLMCLLCSLQVPVAAQTSFDLHWTR